MKFVNGGAVASESSEAAQAAITILNNGGNAVDAAIATVAVQGVTRPFSGGIGGGGFMQIYLAKEKRHLILDHHAVTSQKFGPESFVHPETGEIYPEDVRLTSGMAVAVPGAIKGWEEALENYGSMTLAEVLQPAIETAENGFTVTENFIREITDNASRFNIFQSTKEIYLDEDGNVPKVGDTIKNPDMGRTYRLIAEHGSNVFYEGEIAEAIVNAIQHPPVVENPDFSAIDPDWQQEYGVVSGNLTLDDLNNYETLTYNPLKISYKGYDVYQARFSSSGGITVGLALNILENYDLEKITRSKAMHYYVEAMRYAFADRCAYSGDPKYIKVPEKGLLAKGYALERKQLISDNKASAVQISAGNPWTYDDQLLPKDSNVSSSKKDYSIMGTENEEKTTKRPEESTIHLSVSDKNGNIVSFTNTILTIGGSAIVVPGYGFLLNNMLHRVIPTNKDNHPNYPRPNMRPLSNMSPAIVMKNEKPVVALGSPGAETIMSTIVQTLINFIDFGMTLPDAIDTPRLIEMNMRDGATRYEEVFTDKYKKTDTGDLLEELQAMGHKFVPNKLVQGVGSVTGIEFKENGITRAAAEPIRRGGGTALVQYPTKENNPHFLAE